MHKEINTILSHLSDSGTTLRTVAQQLRVAKKKGATQAAVSDYLNRLRAVVQTEEQEDRILEILDITAGYCQEEYRVW